MILLKVAVQFVDVVCDRVAKLQTHTLKPHISENSLHKVISNKPRLFSYFRFLVDYTEL